MTKKTALTIFNTLKVIAIFSFMLSCGSCFACFNSSKTSYGEEEYYVKPSGDIGYGAKSSTTGGETFGLITVVSGVICLVSAFGTLIFGDDSKDKEESQKRNIDDNQTL